MPIYEVLCEEHGQFEIIAKIGEDRLCPICGKPAKNLIAPVNFEFKCAMDTWSGGKSGIKNNQPHDKPKLPKKD